VVHTRRRILTLPPPPPPSPYIQVACAAAPAEPAPGAGDNTVYFDSSLRYQPDLTGFYVETALTAVFKSGLRSVYAHIRPNEQDRALYLYKFSDDTWMIGDTPNVDNGLAFHDDALDASTPGQIGSNHWRYVSNNKR